MPTKDYNKLRIVGRIAFQITQQSQRNGIVVDLFPQIIIGAGGQFLHFGVSLEWIAGSISVGYARQSFIASETARQRQIEEFAEKLGITKRQQELRWGW